MIARRPVEPFARQFVYFFTLHAGLAGDLCRGVLDVPGRSAAIAPLVVLSGLAVVIAAGDAIELSHQQVVHRGLVRSPVHPAGVDRAGAAALPWIGIDLAVNQPAEAMASFFADSFARRVGEAAADREPAIRAPPRWLGLALRAGRACFSTRRPAARPG